MKLVGFEHSSNYRFFQFGGQETRIIKQLNLPKQFIEFSSGFISIHHGMVDGPSSSPKKSAGLQGEQARDLHWQWLLRRMASGGEQTWPSELEHHSKGSGHMEFRQEQVPWRQPGFLQSKKKHTTVADSEFFASLY